MSYCYVCSDGAVAPARHCQLKDSSKSFLCLTTLGGRCHLYVTFDGCQLDPCHYNFLKLDLMFKSMPLSGMILNVTPNFTELWWHESNFPLKKGGDSLALSLKILVMQEM